MRSHKKVFCFLNGPSLGGAERSFILQSKTLQEINPDYHIHFFVPYLESLKESDTLKGFIIGQGFRNSQISYFNYSTTLYQLSRDHGFGAVFWFVKVIYGLLGTIKNLSKLDIKNPDIWWVGGNKIGFVVFLYGILCGFKGRFLWHFRDYPYDRGFFRVIWYLYRLPHSFNLEAIGNSYNVCAALKSFKIYFDKIHVLYNPIGKIPFRTRENLKYLGTASMMAPWKGVHSLVLFALLYEDELRELGFEKFLVFGDDIYKTKGAHLGYKKQLHGLVEKFKSDFIVFKGLAEPKEIFSDLDIFIHGSLKPEPFGRVICEAYLGGAALISTGLGGSGELIEDQKTGMLFFPNDYRGLYECVKKLAGDDRFNFIQEGKFKAKDIEKKYHQQLVEVF